MVSDGLWLQVQGVVVQTMWNIYCHDDGECKKKKCTHECLADANSSSLGRQTRPSADCRMVVKFETNEVHEVPC